MNFNSAVVVNESLFPESVHEEIDSPSDQVKGRAEMALNLDRILLRNGRTANFARIH